MAYSVYATRAGRQPGELNRQRVFGPKPRLNEAHREARAKFATGAYLSVEVFDETKGQVVQMLDQKPESVQPEAVK